MSSNKETLKPKQDIGFFNSEEISDNEMDIDETEVQNPNNETDNEQKVVTEPKIQKNKLPKVVHTVAPTLSEIESDVLTKLANLNWNKDNVKFDPKIINVIWNDLKISDFSLKKVMLLEFNQYLEKVKI